MSLSDTLLNSSSPLDSITYNSGRNTSYKTICRDIVSDNSTRSDNRSRSNGDTWQNNASLTQPNMVTYYYWFCHTIFRRVNYMIPVGVTDSDMSTADDIFAYRYVLAANYCQSNIGIPPRTNVEYCVIK